VAAVIMTPAALAATEEFDWSGSVGTGQTVEIKGVNGSITAEPSSSGQIEIHAVKHGKKNDPSDVRIEVVEHAGGVTVCAIYPGKDYDCEPGEGGLGARDNDVEVRFTVLVPSGTNFAGRTVNGGIDADSIDGNVEASSVNGGIEATASGWVSATTVNGGIDVVMGRTDWVGELRLGTVNGGINVVLPGNASADVRIRTANGEIDSDFPINMKGKYWNNRADGTIGGGGRELEIESVNGGVTLQNRG
jgi:DUF4097 and DUF4098 domain-containing protein YvlB